jgi:Pectate lyase superfamily protein
VSVQTAFGSNAGPSTAITDITTAQYGEQDTTPITAATLGYFNVLDYGAKGDSVTNDTDAIQRTINIAGANSTIFFPDTGGSYVTGPLLVNAASGVKILGAGIRGSQLNFKPTGNQSDTITRFADPGTCIQFAYWASAGSASPDLMNQCSVENISISSSDTTYDKNGIRIVEWHKAMIRLVTVNGMWGGPNGSCALRIMGHDETMIEKCEFAGSTPVRISQSPHLYGGKSYFDHFHFSNCSLYGPTTASGSQTDPIGLPSALFLIDDAAAPGIQVTNLTIDGHGPWVGSKNGLYWKSSHGSYQSFAVAIRNVRKEQSYGTSNTAFFIDHTGSTYLLFNILFDNCFTSSASETFYYVRAAHRVTLLDCAALSAVTGGYYFADVDTTKNLNFIGVFNYDHADTTNIAGFAGSGYQGSVLGTQAISTDRVGTTNTMPCNATWVK